MSEMRNPTISVVLPDLLKRRLEEVVRVSEQDQSTIVRKALTRYIRERERKLGITPPDVEVVRSGRQVV